MLVGQPELRTKLARPELRQFAQRVSVDFHLRPLDCTETQAYVRHRLAVAGGNPGLFTPEAVQFLYARTKGVPRLLNQLCDMALVYGFAERKSTIDAELVAQVARERGSIWRPEQALDVGAAAVPAGANGGVHEKA